MTPLLIYSNIHDSPVYSTIHAPTNRKHHHPHLLIIILLFTADQSGIIKIWDIRNFQCIQSFSANISGRGAKVKDGSKLGAFVRCDIPVKTGTVVSSSPIQHTLSVSLAQTLTITCIHTLSLIQHSLSLVYTPYHSYNTHYHLYTHPITHTTLTITCILIFILTITLLYSYMHSLSPIDTCTP